MANDTPTSSSAESPEPSVLSPVMKLQMLEMVLRDSPDMSEDTRDSLLCLVWLVMADLAAPPLQREAA